MLYYEKIKHVRQEKGITQQAIANKLNITQQQYFKYEKGINELPIRYLKPICKYLEISADWLLGLTEE